MTASATPPRILPAAIATAVALAILIALGVWQLHRRDWKLAMLAAIDRAEAGPAAPLHGLPGPFSKVSVSGTLLPARAMYGVDVREQLGGPPREGAQLMGVLVPPVGLPVVVDLGWVPFDEGALDPLPPTGAGAVPLAIAGYTRDAERPTWLSAPDDAARRHFYTLDPGRIAAALGVAHAAPFTLVALGTSVAGVQAADSLPRPPNNHLQYAFTWFGLAVTLVGVFGAWARTKKGSASF